jgi:hypothetical protein
VNIDSDDAVVDGFVPEVDGPRITCALAMNASPNVMKIKKRVVSFFIFKLLIINNILAVII